MHYSRGPQSHQELCKTLIRENVLSTPELIEAFESTDRKYFSPAESPYGDHPYEIGGAATISAPHMHALSLELLSDNIILHPGDTEKSFCDVGSGSGYVTGLLAQMILKWRQNPTTASIGDKSRVVGVEVHPGLSKQSIENISKCNPEIARINATDTPIYKIVNADGFKGEILPFAPFDAIHVGVGVDQTPLGLISQLKPGGKCVIPVQSRYHGIQDLILYTRREESTDALQPFVQEAMKVLHTNDNNKIDSFTSKHFSSRPILQCRFIRAQTESSVPAHIPALRPNHD